VEILSRSISACRQWRFVSMRAMLLTVMTTMLAAVSPAPAADTSSDDAVKAAYLYRFAGYVDWPDAGPAGEPFTIAVLGSPSVARKLRHLVPGHLVNGRAVEVRQLKGPQHLGEPQILYVGAGRVDSLRSIIHSLRSKPTLLVTDAADGLDAGSAVNFLTIDNRVRFEVSLTAAERSHLKISADLLAVAVRVLGGHRQSREGCLPLNPPDDIEGGCVTRDARNRPALSRHHVEGPT
jgi:YfiR/HmsC-like